MADMTFPAGIYFNEKYPTAPEYVLGSISIQKEKLMEWLVTAEVNEKGYLKLGILRSKSDPKKIYMNVDNYKPQATSTKSESASGVKYESSIKAEDLPF